MDYREYASDNISIENERKSFIIDSKKCEDDIVRSHLKLVLSISKKYANFHTNIISYEDIVQEGILGLYSALKAFDTNKGIRFSTFARHHILFSIKKYLRSNSHFLSVPDKKLWKIYSLKRMIDKDPTLTREDICFLMKIRAEELEDLNYILGLSEHNISDVKIEYRIQPDSNIDKNLESIIHDLPEEDGIIFSMRYDQNLSWRKIGENLGVSHEYVRKRYENILKSLRFCIKQRGKELETAI